MTYPNSKFHSSRTFPLNRTRCSNLNFSIASFDVKFISRDTALHFRTDFGTCAESSEKEQKFLRHQRFEQKVHTLMFAIGGRDVVAALSTGFPQQLTGLGVAQANPVAVGEEG